jgi:hypothetical protein
MKKTGKITFIIFMIAVASSTVFAKPVNQNMALGDLRKPFNTMATTSRPLRDNHYLTPGGHFIIHYDNSGYDAVPQDFTFNDTIPDFVIKAGEYLDESFSTLHDSLGYDTPPQDDIESPEIDVYFKFDLSYYGVTYPETNLGNNEYTSYLTLSTQLEDSTVFYTYGLEGLRVTCAHELFHIFQLGYRYRSVDIFYFEMSSVWFEEYMYPEVNDYHSYVNAYASNWNYKLDNSLLDYNNAGFNFYIDKRFSVKGNNIIHRIWNRILTVDAMSAIRNELQSRGITFEEALSGWGCAQVLCGTYTDVNFQYGFNDAAQLDPISFDNNTDHILASAGTDITLSKNPATSYYKITGIPNSVLLFESLFDDGAYVNLVCLNADQSKVRSVGSKPLVIDGTLFDEYILVIGTDAEDVSGAYAFTSLTKDQISVLYPNPLLTNRPLNLSYVLLDDKSQGNLSVYDVSGKLVYDRALSADLNTQGLHDLSFVPQELSSGVYFIALRFDDNIIVEKFTYLR